MVLKRLEVSKRIKAYTEALIRCWTSGVPIACFSHLNTSPPITVYHRCFLAYTEATFDCVWFAVIFGQEYSPNQPMKQLFITMMIINT